MLDPAKRQMLMEKYGAPSGSPDSQKMMGTQQPAESSADILKRIQAKKTQTATPVAAPKENGVMSKVGDLAKTALLGPLAPIASEAGRERLKGVAKSFTSLPTQAARLGQSISDKVGETDIGKSLSKGIGETFGGGITKEQGESLKKMRDESTEGSVVTETQNKGQEQGKMIGDIAQFFIPVAGGAKAAQVATKTGEALSFGAKALNTGKSLLKLGGKAATEAFEQGARTSLQTGKADDRSVVSAATGALMPVLGSVLGLAKKGMPTLAKKLEEANLRLTPQQRRTMTDKIDDVTDYMLKNKVVGTAEKRLAKVTAKYDEMEPALDSFLKTEAKDRIVPKQAVLDDLEAIKAKYQDRVDSDAIESQIDKIILNLKNKQGENIAPLNLNKLKRSAYDSAYNEGGNKVLDDVMHDVGDTLRKRLESATDGLTINGKNIAEFNKEYGTLINARKLLKVASSRKDVGFLAKLVASGMGSALGSAFGPIGTAVGGALGPGVAETAVGTLPRSMVGAGLNAAKDVAVPETIKNLGKGVTSQVIQDTESD